MAQSIEKRFSFLRGGIRRTRQETKNVILETGRNSDVLFTLFSNF